MPGSLPIALDVVVATPGLNVRNDIGIAKLIPTIIHPKFLQGLQKLAIVIEQTYICSSYESYLPRL